jgi:hypothetical protein
LLKTMYGMVVLKNYVKNVKLNKLYEMAHDWIKNKTWLPKKKRCPFHWSKK